MSAEFKALGSYAGPEIADSGLVVSLDAGNTKSYPGSGTTWTDLTGNGLNATIGNSPVFSYMNSGILTYSGATAGATATGTSSLFNVGTGDFTLECWAKVSSFAPYSLPVSLDDNLNGNGIIYYLAASPYNFRTWIGNTANNSVTQITTNTWYHLVISRLSGTVSKYINGVLDSTHTAAGSLATGQSIKIGWRYDASYNFTGSIGEVSFYNAAMTAAQVAQNYSATSSRYLGSPISLPDIPGMKLWLDASDSGTLFSDTAGTTLASADGTAVALWKDKSGNLNHASQATSANRPLVKLGIQNNLSVLRFDGSNDFIQPSSFAIGPEPVTIFTVFKTNSTGYHSIYDTSGSRPMMWIDSSGRIELDYPSTYTVSSSVLNSNTLFTYVNASSGGGLRLNGSTIVSSYNTSLSSSATTFFNRSGGQTYRGDFYEMLIYNSALTLNQQQRVEAYLNTKWNIY
jgi:hypothetical protein